MHKQFIQRYTEDRHETKIKRIEISHDEELEAWKSTWDGKSKPPIEVMNFIHTVLFPQWSDKCIAAFETYMKSTK